jgi:hypothetical protein
MRKITTTRVCIHCGTSTTSRWYGGPTCNKCQCKQWSQKNKAHKDDYNKHYRNEHKEQYSSYFQQHYEDNKDKICAERSQYKKNTPGKVNALNAKRQAAKLQATPRWLTKEQYYEIEQLYIEASRLSKVTGTQHDVDHIVPLQGKEVSGLHVPWNLQILEHIPNVKKGNKLIVDSPEFHCSELQLEFAREIKNNTN